MSSEYRPPPIEEMVGEHRCWWRGMVESLGKTLQNLSAGSAEEDLRELLRQEKNRRQHSEDEAAVWEHRARKLGWQAPETPAEETT